MKIKIMTFNTQHCKNYITKKIDYNAVIDLINKYNPDIIGLNEIYGKGFDRNINSNQAENLANALGYYCYFGKATNLLFKPYGNAILSKYPIKEAKVSKIPYPLFKKGTRYYEKRSIIKASIDINGTLLRVYVTHLGLNKDEQINGINTLCNLFENEKFIVMGDFNIDYENVLLQPLNDYTIDTSIKFKERLYSWPSDKPTIKYDYIFTSKNIKIKSANIPNEIVSDHRPYISEIDI